MSVAAPGREVPVEPAVCDSARHLLQHIETSTFCGHRSRFVAEGQARRSVILSHFARMREAIDSAERAALAALDDHVSHLDKCAVVAWHSGEVLVQQSVAAMMSVGDNTPQSPVGFHLQKINNDLERLAVPTPVVVPDVFAELVNNCWSFAPCNDVVSLSRENLPC